MQSRRSSTGRHRAGVRLGAQRLIRRRRRPRQPPQARRDQRRRAQQRRTPQQRAARAAAAAAGPTLARAPAPRAPRARQRRHALARAASRRIEWVTARVSVRVGLRLAPHRRAARAGPCAERAVAAHMRAAVRPGARIRAAAAQGGSSTGV